VKQILTCSPQRNNIHLTINSKKISVLNETNKKERYSMHNKFFQTSGFLGILMLSIVPAESVQRFSMAEDTLYISSDGIKMPTRIRTLEWRGVTYHPVPNRRAKGWLEWNVAPDGHAGPTPIYGEKLTILAETDHANMHYSFCCIPYTQVESGHPTSVSYATQLPFSNNPECIVLYWDVKARGLAAIAKEDWLKRFEKKQPVNSKTPLLPQKSASSFEKEIEENLQEITTTFNALTEEQKKEAIRRMAERGDVRAQVSTALNYEIKWRAEGKQDEQNFKQAVFWYQKAAEQENAQAQYGLGRMYAESQGFGKDDVQAEFWMRKAAKQGHELAIKYLEGKKVKQ
jgi:hypothetical protein